MSRDDELGYKRVYFFKHFLSEEDWNARHAYHMEKQGLHERIFHGVGIHDAKSSFIVKQDQPKPSFRVSISPGLAIDSRGREVFIYDDESLSVDLSKYTLPTTIYFKIVYSDSFSRW